jgi:hypothetical protein
VSVLVSPLVPVSAAVLGALEASGSESGVLVDKELEVSRFSCLARLAWGAPAAKKSVIFVLVAIVGSLHVAFTLRMRD